MNFSQDICNFTKQGRNKVHEDVVVVTKEEIRALLENENPADSVEFNDNRISAYIAQLLCNESSRNSVHSDMYSQIRQRR